MADELTKLGYSGDIKDSNNTSMYPTAFIENIMAKDGSKDKVSKGIIWPSEFIARSEDNVCIIIVKTLSPVYFTFTPTMEYDANYSYYINDVKVTVKTPTDDVNADINWKIGVPVLACLSGSVLRMMSTTQNAHGEYIGNNPVDISDIKNGDLLIYDNGKFIEYTPPVKHIYYPGQLKNWSFIKEGSDLASSPSGLEADILRVSIYGNGCGIDKSTTVATSSIYNFKNYTHLNLKYMNGSQNHPIDFQIHRADGSESFEIDLSYSESLSRIMIDISQYNLEDAYITIATSVYESEISECIVMEMKLV